MEQTVIVRGIGKVRIRLVPTEDELRTAERAKRARGFFLSLVELLLIEPLYTKDDWVKLPEEALRPLARLIARANNLEPFFKPKSEKPFYNAFRNAWRMQRAAHKEAVFHRALAAWKDNLEAGLAAAQRAYETETTAYQSTLSRLANQGVILSPAALRLILPSTRATEILSTLTADTLAQLVDSWFDLPAFTRREKIIRDAFSAFNREEYALSIYGFLPQPEGVLWDYLKTANPAELPVEELIELQGRTFVTVEAFLRDIFARLIGTEEPPFYRFVKFAEFTDDGTLNRHAVEHGISVAFATRENAIRIILLIDFVHFVLEKLQKSNGSD